MPPTKIAHTVNLHLNFIFYRMLSTGHHIRASGGGDMYYKRLGVVRLAACLRRIYLLINEEVVTLSRLNT